MKAYVEFRIPETYAKEFLPPNLGKNLRDFVRRVRVPGNSETYERIGEIYKFIRLRDQDYFFLGWDIQRNYSERELESAELLLLKISKTFEPAGLECGTKYDNQRACEICGSGIQQVSELILDLNTIPKNVDVARTISNEIVISSKMAGILADNGVTGYEIGPVHHKVVRSRADNDPQKIWHQLVVNPSVNVDPITKTGNDPFDNDKEDNYRCKNGHTIGLNILSELSIYRDSWDGSDIVATRQLLGVNRGLLRTYPLLLISQRLYGLMKQAACKGFTVEVVNLST